ncbi:hypothetical protein PCE1_000595 [Barthelona sp. PCE]
MSNRASIAIPPPTVLPRSGLTLASSERGVKHEYHVMQDEWTQTAILVEIEERPFSEGALRYAYKMKDYSRPQNEAYVAKMSKYTNEERDTYFRDVKTQMVAKALATEYNTRNPPKKVAFLDVYVLELIDRPGKQLCSVEKFMPGEYIKHNNNWDFASDERFTPQAFSHFTYEFTKELMACKKEGLAHQSPLYNCPALKCPLLVCDIQGVGDHYTDPQIQSESGKGFGKADLSRLGIQAFFRRHKCNQICRFLGLPCVGEFISGESSETRIGMMQMTSVPAGMSSKDLFDAVQLGSVDVVKRIAVWTNQKLTVTDSNGDTALHLASRLGHIEVIEFLLSTGLEVDILNRNKQTPLYCAVLADQKNVVELLLQQETPANADFSSVNDSTPLGEAIMMQSVEMVRALLNNGASPIKAHLNGEIPITSAAKLHNSELVKILIQSIVTKGLSIDTPNQDGTTGLFAAVATNDIDLIQQFVISGANLSHKDMYGNTPMFSSDISSAVVRFMILHGAAVDEENFNGYTPYTHAFRYCNVEAAKELQDYSSHIQPAKATTLMIEICDDPSLDHKRAVEAVRMLLKFGAIAVSVSDENESALELAIINHHIGVAELLLGSNAEINVEQVDSLLVRLCKQKYDKESELLGIKKKTVAWMVENLFANVNTVENNKSVLYLAILNGNLGVATLLIESSASLSEESSIILLHELITTDVHVFPGEIEHLIDCIEFLILFMQVNPCAVNPVEQMMPMSPLEIAVLNVNLPIAAKLVELGAFVEQSVVDWLLLTVLSQKTEKKNRIQMVKFLIESCGASPNAMNVETYQTAFECAIFGDHISEALALLEFGAEVDPTALNFMLYGLVMDDAGDKHVDSIRFLVTEMGADVSLRHENKFLFDHAAENGRLELCLVIKELGGPASNASVPQLLHSLAEHVTFEADADYVDHIIEILKKIENPNSPLDNSDVTLLQRAVSHGNLIMCGCLSAVDVKPVDDTEATKLLSLAIESDSEDMSLLRVINWLVSECGAKVCDPVLDGRSCLHVACGRKSTKKVRWLIDDMHGDPNCADSLNNRPLHEAIVNGNEEITLFLVSRGADINLENNFGMTPLKVANMVLRGKLTRAATRYQEEISRLNNAQEAAQSKATLYLEELKKAIVDDKISSKAKRALRTYRRENDVSSDDHRMCLESLGWTTDDYDDGEKL